MHNCAIIATYHKSGTLWMEETFGDICRRRNIRFSNIEADESINAENCASPIVVTFPHSTIDKYKWILDQKPYSILHLIRDPRDIIISGMHYHRKSGEKWLQVAREQFGGLSYQNKLNSLRTETERYLFEINSRTTPIEMAAWDYGRPHCYEVKYEDLICDRDLSLFTKIAIHLGFSEDELDDCRQAFWTHSLFGGKASRIGKHHHVRSGMPRQWPDIFDRELAVAFLERFGDVLITLGYESDNSWIDRLPKDRGRA